MCAVLSWKQAVLTTRPHGAHRGFSEQLGQDTLHGRYPVKPPGATLRPFAFCQPRAHAMPGAMWYGPVVRSNPCLGGFFPSFFPFPTSEAELWPAEA